MVDVKKDRRQTVAEEVANSISHGIGALLAVVGTVVLISTALSRRSTIDLMSSILYGSSMILLYLMSTLYHAVTARNVKELFRTFDHCSIFILILGSYIPICLSLLGGWVGWTLLIFNTTLAVLGIVLNAIDVQKWHKWSLLLYVFMGWSIVVAAVPLFHLVPTPGLLLLVGGGLSYSIGIVFYRAHQLRYMHTIWHLLVLGGSALHYFFMLFYVFVS